MALSALEDKAVEPASSDVARVLGPSEGLWYDLIARMETSYGPLAEEQWFSGAKYGWSLRLEQKKRTILYLIPQTDTFLVGIVLGDRALSLLSQGDLSQRVLDIIDAAPRYGEGTGFRIPVARASDCREIETVIEAKMS